MTEDATDAASARDRLLASAAELLDAAQGAEVSTRAILERAGVQAPTLYHHFGSKQGLLDAVVTHGFKRFLAGHAATARDASDPIDVIRAGWDLHVRYGLEHPSFYTRIYGRPVPGTPCGVVSEVEAMILERITTAPARDGAALDLDDAPVASAAIALAAALAHAHDALGGGELALLREWLARLSAPGSPEPSP